MQKQFIPKAGAFGLYLAIVSLGLSPAFGQSKNHHITRLDQTIQKSKKL